MPFLAFFAASVVVVGVALVAVLRWISLGEESTRLAAFVGILLSRPMTPQGVQRRRQALVALAVVIIWGWLFVGLVASRSLSP